MPTFNPPPRNAAAYGDRGDVACAQLCSSVNREQSAHALVRFPNLHTYDHNLKLEFAGNIYIYIYIHGFIPYVLYVQCGSHQLSYSRFLFLPLSLLFSLADPIPTV